MTARLATATVAVAVILACAYVFVVRMAAIS